MSISEKLYLLLKAMLEDTDMIPRLYHPTVLNLVKPYLRKAEESELRAVILHVKNDVIPYLLGESDELRELKRGD